MHANSGVDPSRKNRWRISRPCANSHFNRERKNTILFFWRASQTAGAFSIYSTAWAPQAAAAYVSTSSSRLLQIRKNINIISTWSGNYARFKMYYLHFMCHLGWPFLWWSGMARMLMRRHHLRRNNDPSIKLHCTYASLKDESWPTRPNSSAQLVHVYNKITSVGSPTYLIGRPESYCKFPVFCQKIRICFQF